MISASDLTATRFEPAYLALLRGGELAERHRAAFEAMRACRLCPRDCKIDRLVETPRICRTGRRAVVSSAFAHHGEERCLSGTRGSGTIFFAHCNLRCVFCQNADLSHGGEGQPLDARQIAVLMLKLQADGCHNINVVSPAHVVPHLIEAVLHAAAAGLRIPIVYNTNAYDSLEALRLLDGIVDIYMPDLKFASRDSSKLLVKAKDYPERAQAAILEMHRQVGDLRLDREDIATRGLLVRHLVMPGCVAESEELLAWIAEHLSRDTFVNIMPQYRPLHKAGQPRYEPINRRPRTDELARVTAAARRLGLRRANG